MPCQGRLPAHLQILQYLLLEQHNDRLSGGKRAEAGQNHLVYSLLHRAPAEAEAAIYQAYGLLKQAMS